MLRFSSGEVHMYLQSSQGLRIPEVDPGLSTKEDKLSTRMAKQVESMSSDVSVELL